MEYLHGTFVTHRDFDSAVARFAARRYGVVTRAEAIQPGASQRVIHQRLASGRWERLHPGVYRIAGGIDGSWRQAIMAACLAAGRPSVASYRTAGRVLELVERAGVEVSVLRGKRRRLQGVVVHEVSSLESVDVTVVDGIPVTSATRTVIDLAGVLSNEQFEEVLDDALRRRLTTVRRIRWRARKLGARRGALRLGRALDARDPATAMPQSVLETRLSRILQRAGLPPPERQHAIHDAGRLVAVVDFAYPAIKLAIEADGYRWHSGRARWEKDLGRRNALTSLGWRVIHVTANALEDDPDALVRSVSAALSVEPNVAASRTPLTRGSIL